MRIAALIIASLLLGGCSKYLPKLDEVLPDRTKEYQKSESLPDLEVPPDLTSEGIRDTMAVPDVGNDGVATYSTYQERISARREARRLQENPLAIQTLSDEKVILVEGLPSVVWNDLRRFWLDNGFSLELDDQELGIMETAWLEDKIELSRDRFKVFVEPGPQDNTVVLYISHSGEDMVPIGEDLTWKDRGRDQNAEDAMVQRISQQMGAINPQQLSQPNRSNSRSLSTSQPSRSSRSAPASRRAVLPETSNDDGFKAPGEGNLSSQAPAPAPSRNYSNANTGSYGSSSAEVIHAGEGKYYINVPQDFGRTWSLTEDAISKTSLVVQKKDRDWGVFYVTANGAKKAKKSLLDKMAFWKDDGPAEYQVSLTGVGAKTEIVILNDEGKWDDSDMANSILKEISEQLGR